MSYQRELLFATPLIRWTMLTLDRAEDRWSDEYRVAGSCLVVPMSAYFDCRLTGASFVCDAASALWLTPEQGYRMRRPCAAQRSMAIEIDAEWGPNRRAALAPTAQLQLRLWRREWASGRSEALLLEERLAALVHQTSRPAAGSAPQRLHRAVERARQYLAAAPQRDDTLAEIARAVHSSPFHLARMFRRHTGQSLHAYRTGLRMSVALERIEQGERNQSRLAAELGYSSHSHFSSVFRRCLGTPPGQVRTNLAARRRRS